MSSNTDELIPTRATLLERMKDPLDGTSWQDFFDTYWKLLFSVARKAGLSETEAQDAVQEVMIAVSKEMPDFKYDPARGSFKSWLCIKTRWKVIEQLRRRGPLVREVTLSHEEATSVNPVAALPDPVSLVPDRVWEDEWRENLYVAARTKVTSRLDPEKSQIFDFNVTQGRKAEEVAEIFNVPVERVYMIKHRVAELIEKEVRRLEQETT